MTIGQALAAIGIFCLIAWVLSKYFNKDDHR